MPPAVPATLNRRYRLHEVIGSGAAGRVYRAHDDHLGRDVAIKRLRDDALGGVDERARFQREAIALARISHPNVLPVFDVSTDPDDPYLVPNYCPDGSLADSLQAGPLTPAASRELARHTSAGLAAMHAAGIIHRDVKPSNILRLRDRWLIGDLGVARLDDEAALTQTGARIGTPQYWAPETARGEECTPAVDVYGLGCVLYEALTGQKLFAGGSPVATGFLHATAPPPPLPSQIERADPELAALIERMLAKAPESRPTAATIHRRLGTPAQVTEIQTSRVPVASSDTPRAVPPHTATGATVLVPGVHERPGPSPSVHGSRGLVAIGALLLLGVAGGFALIRSGADPPAASSSGPSLAAAATTTEESISAGRTVPNLEGQRVATATAQLAELDLRLVVSGAVPAKTASGLIIRQVPTARDSIPAGSIVSVTLSAGPAATFTTASSPPSKPEKPAKPQKHDKPKKKHPGRGRP